MLADYYKEREGLETIETDKGFAVYQIRPPEVYIKDIYVKPDYRCIGIASELADQIADLAREQGCTYMAGTVSPQANGATDSLKALLAYGFRLLGLNPEQGLIVFTKKLVQEGAEIPFRGH